MKTAMAKTLGVMALVAAGAVALVGCKPASGAGKSGTDGVGQRTGAALDLGAEKTAAAAKDTAAAAKDAAGQVVEKAGAAMEKAGAATEKAGADMQK